MLEIKSDSKFKIKDSVSVKNILNESFFILDSATGKQYNLTEMEFEIMDLIAREMSFGEIVDKITAEYAASIEQIETDLKEYFNSLFYAGIIDRRKD